MYLLRTPSQVTSLSHPHPNLVHHYEDAVTRLIHILQYSELSNIYTHHIDLVHYCLKCSNVTQDLMKQILNLWLIESDGDIKPLLSLDCDKVVTHLLVRIFNNLQLLAIENSSCNMKDKTEFNLLAK